MADKLRTTYPLRIQFYEGEQPTALKLSAISSQAKSGLNIIEKAIGDLWGNGGDSSVTGLQIPTLGRVLGENKYLNPALYSLYNDTPFYYVEKLSTKFNGETTGYLTFVPHNPGGGYNLVFGDGSTNGLDVSGNYTFVGTESSAVDSATTIKCWVDAANGGSTGKFRFGSPLSTGTVLYIGYWVNPADWDLAQEDIVPGIIPDPRGKTTYPNGGVWLDDPVASSSPYAYSVTLPVRAPLVATGTTGYAGKLPFQLPVETIHNAFDLNTLQGINKHAAFPNTKVPRLWSNTTPTASQQFYRYRIPEIEALATANTRIPDGTLYLCYGDEYEIIEGLEFYVGVNTYTIEIKDTAGLLATKIGTVSEDPEKWAIISCNPSATKRLWALDHSFSHHTHDGTHGDHPFDNLNVDGTIDAGLVVANWGDDSTSGFTFDKLPDSKKSGIQLHELGTDLNPQYGLTLNSQNNIYFNLDTNNTSSSTSSGKFVINECRGDGSDPLVTFNEVFKVDQAGDVTAVGKVDATQFIASVGDAVGAGYTFDTFDDSHQMGMQLHNAGGDLNPQYGLTLNSQHNVYVNLDTDHTGSGDGSAFVVNSVETGPTYTNRFLVWESGKVTATGRVEAPEFTSDQGATDAVGFGFGPNAGVSGFQRQDSTPWNLLINNDTNVVVNLDVGGNAAGSNYFRINDGAGAEVFKVVETGFTTTGGDLFVKGNSIWLKGYGDDVSPRMRLHHSGSSGNAYVDWETGNHIWRYDSTNPGAATEVMRLESDGDLVVTGKVDAPHFIAEDGTSVTQGYGFDTGSTDPTSLGFQYDNTSPYGLFINTPNDLTINLDTNNNGNNFFKINDGAGAEVFKVEETGDVTATGDVSAVEVVASGKVDAPYFTADTGVTALDGYTFDANILPGSVPNPSLLGFQYAAQSDSPQDTLLINTPKHIAINLDTNESSAASNSEFTINNGAGTEVFKVEETGDVTVTGGDVSAYQFTSPYSSSLITDTGYGFSTVTKDKLGIQFWGGDQLKINSTGDVRVCLDTDGDDGTVSFSVVSDSTGQASYTADPIFQVVNSSGYSRAVIRQSNDTTGSSGVANNGLRIERALDGEGWNQVVGTGNGDLYFAYEGVSQGRVDNPGSSNPGADQMNFTGQHRNIIEDDSIYNNINEYVGLIVSSAGRYRNLQKEESIFVDSIEINEALPVVDLTSQERDKKVFGVISNAEDPNDERTYKAGKFVSIYDRIDGDERVIINSLGEGAIWVCNIGGLLFNGDYITSSQVPGYGMLQTDDLLHNYTVAKITCDCDFDLNSTVYRCEEFQFNGETHKRAFVGCTYHCG